LTRSKGAKIAVNISPLQVKNAGILPVIVQALIGSACDLQMSTTAEGVESAEQAFQLRKMNCSEGQGNFIRAPKTAAEIASLTRDRQLGDCGW